MRIPVASRLKLTGLIGFAAILAVVIMPAYLQDRFLTLVDPSYGPQNVRYKSAEGRIGGLLNGFELWNQSPIVGFGPGSFAFATGGGFNSHNVYGQVLGEMGTLGLVVFLGVLLSFFANWLETYSIYRRRPRWPRDFLYQTWRIPSRLPFSCCFSWAGPGTICTATTGSG